MCIRDSCSRWDGLSRLLENNRNSLIHPPLRESDISTIKIALWCFSFIRETPLEINHLSSINHYYTRQYHHESLERDPLEFGPTRLRSSLKRSTCSPAGKFFFEAWLHFMTRLRKVETFFKFIFSWLVGRSCGSSSSGGPETPTNPTPPESVNSEDGGRDASRVRFLPLSSGSHLTSQQPLGTNPLIHPQDMNIPSQVNHHFIEGSEQTHSGTEWKTSTPGGSVHAISTPNQPLIEKWIWISMCLCYVNHGYPFEYFLSEWILPWTLSGYLNPGTQVYRYPVKQLYAPYRNRPCILLPHYVNLLVSVS